MPDYIGKSTLSTLKKIEEDVENTIKNTASVPYRRTLASAELDELKQFDDFKVIEMWASELECYYSPESGTPQYRDPEDRPEVVGKVFADGREWERRVSWVNRGLGTRDVYFVHLEEI
jgi:hypothetical protein